MIDLNLVFILACSSLGAWALARRVWRTLMSRADADDAADQPVDDRVDQPQPNAEQPIAIGNNADNGALTGNAVDRALVPEEAREIIRFQAKIEAITALLSSGKVTNKAEAIEQVFACSRTSKSKPDSPYQRALRALDQATAAAVPEVFDATRGQRVPMTYPVTGRSGATP